MLLKEVAVPIFLSSLLAVSVFFFVIGLCDSDDKRNERKILLYKGLLFIVFLTVCVIVTHRYITKQALLTKFPACTKELCTDLNLSCKISDELTSCSNYQNYSKKELEQRYFDILPECKDNYWNARICKKVKTFGKNEKHTEYRLNDAE